MESVIPGRAFFEQRSASTSAVGRQNGWHVTLGNYLQQRMTADVAFYVILLLMVLLIFWIPGVIYGSSLGIVHQVPEGHVAVYWRGGAMLKSIADPGYHLMIPKITRYEVIQVTLQTDKVTDIPCGTKGGVMIYFDKIEVVNRLSKSHVYETILNYGVNYDKTWIYDKIHHEINQFCSAHTLQEVYIDKFDQIDEIIKDAIQHDLTRYAPGIEIISVRVTKPSIPDTIALNYKRMEEERTKVLIAMEKQKVVEKETETEQIKAITEAERDAKISKIRMDQKIMEKESIKRQQEIENEIFVARDKSLADSNYYRILKEAEANKLKLTPEFLELKFIESISNNTKIYFGDKESEMGIFDSNMVPSMVRDQRLLGSIWKDL